MRRLVAIWLTVAGAVSGCDRVVNLTPFYDAPPGFDGGVPGLDVNAPPDDGPISDDGSPLPDDGPVFPDDARPIPDDGNRSSPSR